MTEGVGWAHLSMFACSLVRGKVGGGGGRARCLYRVISGSPQARAAAVATVPLGLSAFILGDGRGEEINKKKANSSDRRIFRANEEF